MVPWPAIHRSDRRMGGMNRAAFDRSANLGELDGLVQLSPVQVDLGA